MLDKPPPQLDDGATARPLVLADPQSLLTGGAVVAGWERKDAAVRRAQPLDDRKLQSPTGLNDSTTHGADLGAQRTASTDDASRPEGVITAKTIGPCRIMQTELGDMVKGSLPQAPSPGSPVACRGKFRALGFGHCGALGSNAVGLRSCKA